MSRIVTTFIATVVFVLTFLTLLHRPEAPPASEEPSGRSGAMEALDFWTQARSYPGKDIPAGAYYRAYEQAIAKRKLADKSLNSLSSSLVWEPIGPTNLHGRTLAV